MINLWEILVPTERRISTKESASSYYTTRYHRVWDAKVRAITGGLTIMPPVKGQWIAPSGELFKERMIPVRLLATREQMNEIIPMTAEYYDQLAVLAYRLSNETILFNREIKE